MVTASGSDEFVGKFPDEVVTIKASFLVTFVSFGIEAFFGLIQALHRMNVFRVIDSADYYTVLTGHGVSPAITLTIFSFCGVFCWMIARSLDRPAENALFSWAWAGLTTMDAVLITVAIPGGFVSNLGMSADVLFTLYVPPQAHPMSYTSLAAFTVGTWLAGVDRFLSYRAWRQEYPDEHIPLQTFMILTTMITWYISTPDVAVSVVFFLISRSLGLIESINPLLTQTLPWYLGHPIAYFRLMPACPFWYTVLPKLTGGQLFSDPLACVVFVLFPLLSTPVGIHHRYLNPGTVRGFKFIAMTNTMFLFFPSLLTAPTVVANVRYGARQRGSGDYLRWLSALPRRDPAFTSVIPAGAIFAAGGFSGIVNAGMDISYLIHNTPWVPGHFHLTVGTAVALTMTAGPYWLVPQVMGRRLYNRPIGLLQVIMWSAGMVFTSNVMRRTGLADIPRRTVEPQYQNFEFLTPIGSIFRLRVQIALGRTLLFPSAAPFLFNILLTLLDGESDHPVSSYLPEPPSGSKGNPRILDNLTVWTGIAAVLVVFAYTLPLASIIQNGGELFGDDLPAPATALIDVNPALMTVTGAFNTL